MARTLHAAAFTVLLLLVCRVPAVAQDAQPKLSDAAAAFLKQLRSTGRSTVSGGGVNVQFAGAPVYCQGMLDALHAKEELDESQRQTLAKVLTITFEEPGWFMGVEVAAATYGVGLDKQAIGLVHTLNDSSGKCCATDGFAIFEPTDMALDLRKLGADKSGATLVTWGCGNIAFTLRFLAAATHARLLGKVTETTVGQVTIVSDIRQPEAMKALATEADASIAVHAGLLCAQKPKGTFRVNLLAKEETYQALDMALTGGEFQHNGAVSAHLTCQAYIWYVVLHPAAAFTDVGVTLKNRALVVHELHHLVSWRCWRAAMHWPLWLAEGFAEYGAQAAIAARDAAAGRRLHDDQGAGAAAAYETNAFPSVEDWLGGYMPGGMAAYYALSYFVVRELAAARGKLEKIFKGLESSATRFEATILGQQLLEENFDSARVLVLKAMHMRLLGKMRTVYGHLDETPSGLRLISAQNYTGRVLLGPALGGDRMTLEGGFSFTEIGLRQADFFLAYSEGRHTANFIKVAISPTQIRVQRFRHGTWLNWGTHRFESQLDVGAAGKPAWNKVKLVLDARARKLAATVSDRAAVEFEIKEYISINELRAGFGVESGCGYFKDLKVSAAK